MCDKQLGAAPGAETEPVKGSGWFARLRAQPGFKTAAVAFVLTVILGVGGPAAYAYWSASTDVAIKGTTAPPATPVPVGGRCDNVFLFGARLAVPAQTTADPEARFVLTFQSTKLKNPVSVALPQSAQTAQTIQPIELGFLTSVLSTTGGQEVDITVTVQTAILTNPKTAVAVVSSADFLRTPSNPSAPITLTYLTTPRYDIPTITCKRA
ncbi:hypothetical protein [Arthrobacter yangruifuii]|uniref:hypothetical protein n=1 Tax=Arthrobacter yangruifuii TaxID=2606616 RepID=UPI0011B5DBF5|nr:hypothetical protein [Arthrobacter yangruifuii]